ncbi:MAG: radical SAM protein, partial [Deltaproteobacteria bacterium]|nr:radical SAM protein [Deltaproteobacteria bacterium]
KGVFIKGRSPFKKICSILDLNNLPQPDPALWPCPKEGRQDLWLPFQTRRGCPLACSYCSTASIEGTTLRKREPLAVAEHIRSHAQAGFTRFYCTDNTFNLPAEYARDLCRAFIDAELNVSWTCIVYPYKIDEPLVADMARAGCIEVSLGFESGSPAMLKNMRKRFSPDDVRQAAELFKKHRIRLNGYLMLGGPGETRDTVLESFAFADSLPLDFLKITTGIRIYPDTELARIAVSEGVVAADDGLLLPRFYFAEGLEGWLQEEITRWAASRPHWQG